MPRKNDDVFYKLVALKMDVKEDSVKRYLEAMIEVIATELYVGHIVSVPGLGYFKTIFKDGSPSGGLPEYNKPKFVPCDDFVCDCNLFGCTKEFRKRLQSNTLTKKDIDRIKRANALEQMSEGVDAVVEKSKDDFGDYLKNLKKGYERENNG